MLAAGIFLLTYALIAGRRLRFLPIGRPAGALLGCFLMVALGVLGPEAAFAPFLRFALAPSLVGVALNLGLLWLW